MSFTDPQKAKTYLNGFFSGTAVTHALELVYEKHNGLRKDGKTPEWFHQLSILMYLMTMEASFKDHRIDTGRQGSWEGIPTRISLRFDWALYKAALLHDIHEDYGYPLPTIAERFSPEVARSVELLSKKTPGGPKKATADYYQDMAADPFASIVKGADRIHNIQTMPGVFKPEKMTAYLQETEEHVLPMLKKARKNFPQRRPVYENIKHVLVSQSALIRFFLNGEAR
jgi:(p)ppGpp synthase/HD superfamily hydrolase